MNNDLSASFRAIEKDVSALKGIIDMYKIKTYYVQSYNPVTNTIRVTDYQSGNSPKAGIDVNNPLSIAGISGKGLHAYPKKGSRVYCCKSDTNDMTICIGVAQEPSKANGNINEGQDPSGEFPYPSLHNLEHGLIIQDDSGSEIELNGKGGMAFINSHNLGFMIYKYAEDDSILYNINSNINTYSKGEDSRSGFMMRFNSNNPERLVLPSSENQNKLEYDVNRHLLEGIGFVTGTFPNSPYISVPFEGEFKNFARSESRSVYNHMEREFRGWDLYEADSVRASQNLYEGLDSDKVLEMKYIFNGFNSLNMAPNQIVEVISGNVSKNRVPLDINYLPIVMGDLNFDPKTKRSDKIIEASRLDKRGIGYHFQLNTRTKMSEESKYNNNFVFAVDKQGAFRLNVPKTDRFGNIPFPVDCDYYSKGLGINSFPKSLIPKETKIPIVRQEGKDEFYPPLSETLTPRKTGIRYYGLRNFSGKHDAFSNENLNQAERGGERVSPTLYHNMWACAERSIANSISSINNVSYSKIDESNPIYKFARYTAAVVSSKDLQTSGKKELSTFSEVEVIGGSPAIYHGGDVSYGANSSQKASSRAYSNAFEVKDSEPVEIPGTEDPSGISANINLEGSLISSFGKDSKDGKSILMDCAGSMISWFGQDSNGRSIVTQTDGAVIMEIGNPDKNDVYNAASTSNGSLYLRVNVTSKGTVDKPVDNNNGETDDYIISISEKGLMIWGANPNTPMVFRNAGDINLESTRGSIYLSSGEKIYYKEGVKKFSNIKTKTSVPVKKV